MNERDILSKIDRQSGMTVPDGYFADFAAKMAESLPVREFEEKQPKVLPRTFWQRIRPYAYMAAMFAGIWCMMKMFGLMSAGTGINIETNPMLAEAVSNDAFIGDYCIDDIDDYDLLDELYSDGFIPATLAQ